MIYDLGESSGEVADYVSVPAGQYVCTVAEVAPGHTRAGDERWGLRLVVAEGEFAGRVAAWDGLVFSDRGRDRLRMVLGALGLANHGTIELDAEELVGRRALVMVEPREYENPTSGRRVRRNEVPYDGFRALPEPRSGDEAGQLTRAGDDDSDEDTVSLAVPF